MSAERPSCVGLAWYAREAYPDILRVMADGHKLPQRWEAWRVSAEQVEGEVARSGIRVVRAHIEPGAFAAWCAEHGIACDAAARTRFAAEVAQETAAGG